MTISSIMKCAFSMLNIIYTQLIRSSSSLSVRNARERERRRIVSYIKLTLHESFIINILGFLTTFSKYLSIVSTKLWMNSSMLSSFYNSNWYIKIIRDHLRHLHHCLSQWWSKEMRIDGIALCIVCVPERSTIQSGGLVTVKCPYLAFCAGETLTDKFSFKRDLLLHREAIIVFGDARLALLVDHQNKLDHCLFPCHPYLY